MMQIRWHGRGGQGAKTASQLLAMAMLDAGRYVQAFPEYGPERSGAPVRAYNRSDDRPIRRRDGVGEPDVVVVLDPSLLEEVDVTGGLERGGLLIINSPRAPGFSRLRVRHQGRILCVPADDLASRAGTRFPSVVLLGAVAAALGEPPPAALRRAVQDHLGKKLSPAALAATLAAVGVGFDAGGVAPSLPEAADA